MDSKIILVVVLILMVILALAMIRRSEDAPSGDATTNDNGDILPEPNGDTPPDSNGDIPPDTNGNTSPGQYTINPGTYDYSFEHGGLTRTFQVYVPSSYDKSPTPLLFNLHGGFGNGKQQCEMSGMYRVSDEKGFILVCPDGTPGDDGIIKSKFLYWNDGVITNSPAYQNNVDDVGFVEEMLDHIGERFNVDNSRVYSTGLSNGAILSYRLACELSDRITAVGPVAGTMGKPPMQCNPPRQVPIINFQGIEDTNIPYYGGMGSGFAEYEFPSVQDSIGMWISINGLSLTPTDTGRVGQYAKYEAYGNEGQAQVVLWTLEDGAHTWPGGEAILGGRTGNVNQDISASEVMWEFFDKYEIQ